METRWDPAQLFRGTTEKLNAAGAKVWGGGGRQGWSMKGPEFKLGSWILS